MRSNTLNSFLVDNGLRPVLPGAVFSFKTEGITRFVTCSKRTNPFWTKNGKTAEVTVTNHGLQQQVFTTDISDIQTVCRFPTQKMSRLFIRQQPTRGYSAKQHSFYLRAYGWAPDFANSCQFSAYTGICYKTYLTKMWMNKLFEGDDRMEGSIKPHTQTFHKLCATNWWLEYGAVRVPKVITRSVYHVLASEIYEEHSAKFDIARRYFMAVVNDLEGIPSETFVKEYGSVAKEFEDAAKTLSDFEVGVSFYLG
jgi:hypothetical protein